MADTQKPENKRQVYSLVIFAVVKQLKAVAKKAQKKIGGFHGICIIYIVCTSVFIKY